MNVRRFAALVFVACGLATGAAAQALVQSEQAEGRLIADRTTVAPGETLWLGLNLKMKKGWHTYWRTPGDSGLPTTITWALPAGMSAGAIQWPPPERVPTGDLMNFGYEGEVTLLTPVKVEGAPGAGKIVADAMWLVCAEVCIPEDGHFEIPITIAAANGPLTEDAALIDAARKTIPAKASFPVTAKREPGTYVITLGPGLPAGVTGAALFADGDGVMANAGAQEFKLAGDQATLRVPVGATPPQELTGVVVLEGAQHVGVEISANAPATAAGGDMTLVVALLFAVLGGLILNVMPCVLPVLVMKALSVVSRGDNAAELRRDALVYTAGVMTAFTALAVLLLALRTAGSAVGWGFQLQDPIVVAVLANIMLLLGLSLSGVFTIGNSIAGVGQGLATQSGGWGSYFTGILAVVVAAPCTAPFMGVALGFALTQSPIVAVATFEGLALGLALPYLAIAFIPGFAKVLPRPGVWMERVKQVLAFGLYGAAAWLLWVLTQQLDPPGLALALASLLAVSFAAWSFGIGANARGWMVAAAVAVLIAVVSVANLSGRTGTASAQAEGAEPYSAARVAALRAEGKPVLVNFTAAWCITCLVNERVAFSTDTVKQALASSGVAYLKADWTNRNPEITATLHALGRDGVPVYALYPKGNGAPQLLPQVLTPTLVADALIGAGGSP